MKAAELEALGQRAVACKGWRWMPGMLLLWKLHERGGTYQGRVCHLGSSDSGAGKDVYCEGRGDRFDGVLEAPNCFPDLSDPATLGCLLALVREAYRNDMLWAFPVEDARGKWSITIRDAPQKWFYGSTEAKVLVAALEAAP